ncbi:MAG: GGDEF domain-containing protein [Butyrivibrio sp.]|nr:GGDEF domain-containing protein [Butyrivibrio sp.]
MGQFKRYFAEVDNDMRVESVSEAFAEYTGEASIKNLGQIIPSQDLFNLRNMLFAIEPGNTALCCFRAKKSDGRLSWIAATVQKTDDGTGILKFDMSDIQSMKADSADGYFDSMTGLLGKSAITEYAKELMSTGSDRTFYFFLMDIDHFKAVNDTFGHMKGDEVIIDVAHIAKECVGDKGAVGRIGGDEFMLVLDKIKDEEEVRLVLRDIRYTIREKYKDEDGKYTITASLGGALFPDAAMDYDSMFQLSDKMLYIAKTKGRDRYVIYTPMIHGNILYDGKVMTLSQQMLMGSAKNRLMMEFMEKYLVTKEMSFEEAFKKLIPAYLLDEAYIIDKDSAKSIFGLKVASAEKGKEVVFEDSSMDLGHLDPAEYEEMFACDPIKVINMYDLEKDNQHRFAEFMADNNYRILVVYYMRSLAKGRYIIYVNNINSSCRFSETDFSDLTYFSKMIELRCPYGAE